MAKRRVPQDDELGRFWRMGGLAEDPRLDEVQRALVQKCEEAFIALWPRTLRAPYALVQIQHYVVELVTYTLRNERGRAIVGKKAMARLASDEGLYGIDHNAHNDLATASYAKDIVIGLVAALQGIESDLPVTGVADAVAAWLAGEQEDQGGPAAAE